jgi:hypothetical protein
LLRQQINIRAFDQLLRFDSEPCHDSAGLTYAGFDGFALLEHDFDFEEVP